MKQYLDLLHEVLVNGRYRKDRTGIGTISRFGETLGFDMDLGFPLVTTKRVAYDLVKGELISFLRGFGSFEDMRERGAGKLWDAFEAPGKTIPYGRNWRSWNGCTDQLRRVVNGIKKDPYSRRHFVTAWNPEDVKTIDCLPPCHVSFQFYVDGDSLDCAVYMRSCDLFIGLPFNIASYATLLLLVANECGLSARRLLFTLGDAHIYCNHIPQVLRQLERRPLLLPSLTVASYANIDNITADMITLENYTPHRPLPGTLNV